MKNVASARCQLKINKYKISEGPFINFKLLKNEKLRRISFNLTMQRNTEIDT